MDELTALKREAENLRQEIEKQHKEGRNTCMAQENASVPPIPPLHLQAREILEGHLSCVYSLQWGQDSRKLLSASKCGRLISWDTYEKETLHVIPMRYNWVMSCACSPSFRLAASGGMDNACSIYALGRPKTEITAKVVLKGHSDYLSCCKFADEERVVTGSGDSQCLLWDVETGKVCTKFIGHDSGITSIALLPGMQSFVTGCCDASAKVKDWTEILINLWDIRDGQSHQTFRGHQLDVNTVAFFPSGQAFGTGSDDSTCRLFDIRADQELARYEIDADVGGVTSIGFTKSGRVLLAGFDDYCCYSWDVLKTTTLGEWAGREHRVSCLDVAPNGTAIATGSWDSVLKIWN